MLGQDRMHLDGRGGLLIRTGNVAIGESRPVVYQVIRGERSLVPGRFVMAGHDAIGFAVGEHDPRLPLVIDTTLLYSTYLGGSEPDAARSVAVDGQGNTYVTGYTESSDFPLAHPAQGTLTSDPSCPGPNNSRVSCDDAFVTKLSADGGTSLYSTYLGGSRDDDGRAIAVDTAGDAYVTGTTLSADFPAASAMQSRFGGGGVSGDAFVAALKPAGDGLIFSTYFGGQADDMGEAVALSEGSVYVTGRTESPDFPTLHAFQSSYRGGAGCGYADSSEPCSNAFVARLTAAGSLVYSSFLGGSMADEGLGVAALDGEAYVTGATSSPDFPTKHALQPSLAAPTCASDEAASAGGTFDGWVAEMTNPAPSLQPTPTATSTPTPTATPTSTPTPTATPMWQTAT
jgi:hypothetical protein